MKRVKIVSNVIEGRGNSWYFDNIKERVYFDKINPTEAEVAEGEKFAAAQYEGMGWGRCFVDPPQVIVEAVN